MLVAEEAEIHIHNDKQLLYNLLKIVVTISEVVKLQLLVSHYLDPITVISLNVSSV